MLLLAPLATLLGLGLLAASMPRHWRQLRAGRSCPAAVTVALRIGGSAALAVSFALCLARDHPTMAVLVWIMLLAVAAVAIALWLAGRPTPDRP